MLLIVVHGLHLQTALRSLPQFTVLWRRRSAWSRRTISYIEPCHRQATATGRPAPRHGSDGARLHLEHRGRGAAALQRQPAAPGTSIGWPVPCKFPFVFYNRWQYIVRERLPRIPMRASARLQALLDFVELVLQSQGRSTTADGPLLARHVDQSAPALPFRAPPYYS